MNYSGKKVAVLGFGLEGQDLCRFLLKQKAEITVLDQKKAPALDENYQIFRQKGIQFRLGPNYLKEGLEDFEIVFRSPGFKYLLPEIMAAKKAGSIISSATKLFFDLCPGKIIGVTGTKGKGTTAALIYQILKKSGKEVFLAGNIGQPMLSLLPDLGPETWVVLELSSFQLQDLTKSPHLAVVLFITSEHLDYHRNRKEYLEAKSQIVRHQKKDDWAVLNADDQTAASFASLTKAQVFYFSGRRKVKGAYVKRKRLFLFDQLVGKTEKLLLLGTHNWENVSAAMTAGYLAEADLEAIKKAVFSFQGLEHRLEPVRKSKGVQYYNDSFSTTPETTAAAVRAFKKPIILIAGGSEKGSDYGNLGKEITRSSVKALILFGKTAARIRQACLRAGFQGEILSQAKNMKEAVRLASRKAKAGEIVLLSPACASFDMFANYKERGALFKEDVQAL